MQGAFDKLSLLAKTHNSDVICIVETWLSADISDPEIAIPGYYAHRLDRNRSARGGGCFTLYPRNVSHHHSPSASWPGASRSFC